MLLPYPNSFPQEALMMMLDKIRGKEVAVPELVNAAWNVAGYALAQSIGGGQVIAGEIEALSKLGDEELLSSILEQHGAKVSDTDQVASLGLVPWLMIARIAIKLLKDYILD
jgi:hypothetical protein